MSDKKLEATIKDSFEKITPDVLDSILRDCTEKENVLVLKESVTNRNPVRLRRFASLAAAFIILFGSVIGVNTYLKNQAVSARVSLDVNPSVEIQVNRNERVLDVIALNEDGQAIIGDMDFSGSDIDVAVNALIGSMMRNGFLTDMANSILVTVSGDDVERDAALQARITEAIEKILAGNSVSGAILSQVLVEDQAVDAIAKEYGITPGKVKLIEELMAKNPLYKIEDLVPLTINELNLLILSNEVEFADIKTKGTASDTAYIGNEAAENKALGHAGVTRSAATWMHSRLELEDGRMVYDIEFHSGGWEYEYDIDAKTGEVVKYDKDIDDDYVVANSGSAGSSGSSGNSASSGSSSQASSGSSGAASAALISADEAKSIAFSRAGVSASQVSGLEIEMDRDNGRAEYDIEFHVGGYEYSVEVDAATGNITAFGKETDDDYSGSYSNNSSGGSSNSSSGGNSNNNNSNVYYDDDDDDDRYDIDDDDRYDIDDDDRYDVDDDDRYDRDDDDDDDD